MTLTWAAFRSECKLKSEELKHEERGAIEDSDLERAEGVNAEINDLREKEILLRNFMIIEENQRAVS